MTQQMMPQPVAVTYVAQKNFSLGNPPAQIKAGMPIMFDGFNICYGGMPPRPLPQFRGAISARWVVSQEEVDSGQSAPQQAVRAPIQLRPADGGDPMNPKTGRTAVTTAQAEEREVAQIGQHAESVRQNNLDPRQQPMVQSHMNAQGYYVEVEYQDGKEIRRLRNKPGSRHGDPIVLTGSNSTTAISRASGQPIEPGPGVTRDELVARMDPEEAARYQAEVESRKMGHEGFDRPATDNIGMMPQAQQPVDFSQSYPQFAAASPSGFQVPVQQPLVNGMYPQQQLQPGMVPQQQQPGMMPQQQQPGMMPQQQPGAMPVHQAPDQMGQVVTHLAPDQTTQKEGFTVTNETGGGTEIADLSGLGGKSDQSTVEAEGITFNNTNGPKKDVRPAPVQQAAPPAPMATDLRRQIAKGMCPDFPDNYDFDSSVRKKIARIQADFEDRADIIRAVMASENDAEVKAKLVTEFPQVFGG